MTTVAAMPTQASTQRFSNHSNHDAKRAALDLDLRRPVKHAGRNSTGIWGVNRQGCRFSRPAPWMARGGGPPNTCRITGTPSVSEVPSVGASAFCLLLRSSKVSRRKGGTHSSRYLNNGYVPGLIQHPGRLPGRRREQAPSPQVQRHTQNCADTEAPMALNQSPDESTDTPLSGASPLPHLDRGLTVRWWSAVRPPREQAPSHIGIAA
ncbi:hypothetical protein PS720_05183 [Pseudomonas fluorescens]|nr:hypothetical protein PS720_05183 [Pseudomonas fluorescens]